MNLGDVLVVGAKKNGDLSSIKELESITNSNLTSKKKKNNSKRKSRNKRGKVKSKPKSKETNLCKSCENYECLNRRPYKTSCASYVKCKTSRFKTYIGNYGNTGSGSRFWREQIL